jgi:hypothetical protein
MGNNNNNRCPCHQLLALHIIHACTCRSRIMLQSSSDSESESLRKRTPAFSWLPGQTLINGPWGVGSDWETLVFAIVVVVVIVVVIVVFGWFPSSNNLKGIKQTQKKRKENSPKRFHLVQLATPKEDNQNDTGRWHRRDGNAPCHLTHGFQNGVLLFFSPCLGQLVHQFLALCDVLF